MKKYFLIFLLTLLVANFANAQFATYSSYDNEESAVFEVEDMSSYEIKNYNEGINKGEKPNNVLFFINAGRAQNNLINAPATIIDFHIAADEVPGAEGSVGVIIELLNTTPKTIKEITLEFEFENNNSPVYDIKTGDKYLVLKFENLTGRSNSDKYGEIAESLMKCYHVLSYNDATYKKLFYNKKASTVKLHNLKIKYNDGTSTTKAALFDNGFMGKDRLMYDGPLSPIIRYLEYVKKEKPQEVKKEEAAQSPQHKDEVFTSAARMPSFPGGDAALMAYINRNMKYPQNARDNNIQGKVIVQFVVKKDGTVGDVKVVRGVDKELDAEAVRIVKTIGVPNMIGETTKFSPGRNAVGDPIDVWYTLPVTFKFSGIN